MANRRLIASFVALACLCAASAGAAGATRNQGATYDLTADGSIQIGTDGQVLEWQLSSAMSPSVSAKVNAYIKTWRFTPITVDGHAVTARTALQLNLHAVPAGDGYTLTVSRVAFGQPKRSKFRPPEYPAQAVRAHLSAKTLLWAQVDADGHATQVLPYQTSLGARSKTEAEADNWRNLFEQASMRAVRTWHFDLTEMVDGRTIGGSVLIPINFIIDPRGAGNDGQWRAFIAGPVHPIPGGNRSPLLLADGASQGLLALSDDAPQALDSLFHLTEDPVGKTL